MCFAYCLTLKKSSNRYIWHRHYATLLEVIPGHSSTVNCVAWPTTKNFCALVSAADDKTVCVWRPAVSSENHFERESSELLKQCLGPVHDFRCPDSAPPSCTKESQQEPERRKVPKKIFIGNRHSKLIQKVPAEIDPTIVEL